MSTKSGLPGEAPHKHEHEQSWNLTRVRMSRTTVSIGFQKCHQDAARPQSLEFESRMTGGHPDSLISV